MRRRRDRCSLDVRLRVQSLSGQQGRAGWVVTAADRATHPAWAANALMPEPLPTALHLPSRLPIGVVVRDPELRCTWANDTQGIRDGIPLHLRLGRRLTEAAPGPQAETFEALMRQVLESGVPVFNVEFRTSVSTAGRDQASLSASFFRLDNAQGQALGVCVVSVDVTDRRRAHERLAILGEASKRIGTTLDVMRTAQELADLTVPLLADYATVDLAEAVWTGEEPEVRLGTQGGHVPAFRRAGLAWATEGTPEPLFARDEPVLVSPRSPVTGVLRRGKSHFEPMLATCLRTWLNPSAAARGEEVRDDTVQSLIVVPIHARGAVLGLAVFMRNGDRAPFEEDDLLLVEELVSRAALSLDNARRYARERSTALTLQRHLLPHHPAGGSAADVAWRYLPADSHRGVGATGAT
jgi:GAF domain-containing protein